MFTRIVKLSIRSDATANFEKLFETYKHDIRNQPGCTGLKLLRDKHDQRIFFTYSLWENEKDLNNYRESALFEKVWGTTKTFFDARPEAWSVDEVVVL